MFIDSELNLSILVNLPKNLGFAQYFRFCANYAKHINLQAQKFANFAKIWSFRGNPTNY